jgi:mRNA interferase MazF
MIQTIEAVIDDRGRVHLLGPVRVDGPRRALVTILDEPAAVPGEAALLAEAALAADWNRPEEDAAWSYLQPGK